MKRTVVRYRAKPEAAQENERLIANVFKELNAKSPQDVRYMVLKLADGSFVHFSIADGQNAGSPLQRLEAFQLFQATVKDRCAEPPQANDATIVGHYRMLISDAD